MRNRLPFATVLEGWLLRPIVGRRLAKEAPPSAAKQDGVTPYRIVVAAMLAATPVVASDLPPPLTAPNYDPSLLAKQPVAVDTQWAVHAFAGVSASRTRLVQLIPMPWSGDCGDTYLVAGALSRRPFRSGYFTLEGEVGGGCGARAHPCFL